MPRKYSPRKEEPLSLRDGRQEDRFTAGQVLCMQALVAALVDSGAAVYLRYFDRTSEYSLKIYQDGDQYADVLRAGDDFAYLCGDYAAKLGCVDTFRVYYREWGVAEALSGPQRPERGAAEGKIAATPPKAAQKDAQGLR